MRRVAVTNGVAAGLVIVGVIIGVMGYYVATTYQTKIVTVTTTQSTTVSLTETLTQTVSITSTTLLTTTLTQTLTSVSIVSTTIYPIPDNVTLVFTNVDGYYQYNVQAGSSSTSGEWAGDYSLKINGLLPGQAITISATTGDTGGCRVGQVFTMELFLNGQMVGQAATSCGGGPAVISYTV